MAGEDSISDDSTSIDTGEPVYDQDGTLLGYVSDLTAEGFEVSVVDPERSSAESGPADGEVVEHRPGQAFGEGHLMWRCGECGAMGELEEGIPETCPNCGAPEEGLQTVEED